MEEVLRIGSVISVKGRQVEVQVDKTKNTPHLLYNGEVLNNVSVGSYIKICKGFESIVGKIDGEYITEDKYNQNKDYQVSGYNIKRVLIVSILGYFDKGVFKQGIKELPLIYNECYILTQQEFDKVHNFIKVINGVLDIPIDVACLASETGKRISLGVNSLFASHIGIFGNTGSGKSYTLAGLYHKLFDKFGENINFRKNARIILIDFNGEYVNKEDSSNDNIITKKTLKDIYILSTGANGSDKKLEVSNETLMNPQLWQIVLQATEKTQAPFIESAIKSKYLKDNIHSDVAIRQLIKNTLSLILTQISQNQEKGTPWLFLEELSKFGGNDYFVGIENLIKFYKDNLSYFTSKDSKYYSCKLGGVDYYSNKPESSFVEEIINKKVDLFITEIKESEIPELFRIKLLIDFHYYYSIQKGYYQKEHIGHILGRLDPRMKELSKLITVGENKIPNQPLTIISLRDVNVNMRKLIPMILCNQIYEDKKRQADPTKYLNIIIDEAHNILSSSSIRESEVWKDYRLEVFEEIIKEGRKFGVFLTIASQRPSDISSTIISQLHNYFLHRLINNKDIEAVERTISYLDRVSFDALPILPTGSCILAGLAAQVPVIVQMDKIDDAYEPYNKTIKLTDYWS